MFDLWACFILGFVGGYGFGLTKRPKPKPVIIVSEEAMLQFDRDMALITPAEPTDNHSKSNQPVQDEVDYGCTIH